MGLNGLSIPKSIIQKFIDDGLKKYTINDLQGIDEIGSFRWSKFRKGEFEQIINVFTQLFNNSTVLSSLDDKQLFFVNLNCGITEFDIITLLNYGETKVVVNIEVKSLEGNVKEQIKKRVNEFLPLLFPKRRIISIGFKGKQLISAIYQIEENEPEETNEYSVIDEFLKKSSYNKSTFHDIKIMGEIDSIHKIYKDIESGNFKYHTDILQSFKNINNALNEEVDVIICNSKAGFGKTVLALKLFFERDDVHLLMMNQKFYNALNMGRYYQHYLGEKSITYGTDRLLELLDMDPKKRVVIIDEAQRVGKSVLKKIIMKAKSVIWFGDVKQSFNRSNEFIEKANLINYLDDNEFSFKEVSLKDSKRYHSSVDRAIAYLLGYNKNEKSLKNLQDYEINIFYSEKEFIKALKDKEGKLFTTYELLLNNETINIGGTKFNAVDRNYWHYAISNDNINRIGHTHHALSFDVEDCFVYVKNATLNDNKDRIIRNTDIFKNGNDQKRFSNELYVLFTRGKKSLNIFVDDLDVYLYLNKRSKQINRIIEK